MTKLIQNFQFIHFLKFQIHAQVELRTMAFPISTLAK